MEGTGTITTRELGPFLKSLGQFHTNVEIEGMIQEVDADGNGVVGFPELVAMMARKMKDVDTEDKVMEAFKVFDRDGSGAISIEDLKRVMTNLGDKLTNDEISSIIREADMDGNDLIDSEEFVRMMMAK